MRRIAIARTKKTRKTANTVRMRGTWPTTLREMSPKACEKTSRKPSASWLRDRNIYSVEDVPLQSIR